MDVMAADSEAVYGTNGRHRRLVIHELCRMATTPPSVRQSTDEISDDEREEDEEVAPHAAVAVMDAVLDGVEVRNHEHVHEHHGSMINEDEDEASAEARPGLQPASLDGPAVTADISQTDTSTRIIHHLEDGCEECEREQNAKICELAQLMIDMSHSLGPIRVALSQDSSDEAVGEEQANDPSTEEEVVDEAGERYQFHDSILTVPDSNGKTPLHVLCEGSCDMRMMRIIFGNTRESTGNPSAPTSLSLLSATDSRGSTPLHYLAFSRQCPFSSIRYILDFCEPVSTNDEDNIRIDPTVCCDSDGDTPLHWALDGYSSPRRIKELLRHSKDAIVVLNNAGKRPFDQFAANFIDSEWKAHDISGRELWDSVQAYLRVVFDVAPDESCDTPQQGNKSEWLPLHHLAGSRYDLPLIFTDIALHYSQDELSKADSHGMLPLHLACRRRSANPDIPCDGSIAYKILAKYPQAAYKAVEPSKRLALHLAVATQKPMSLITALIRAYPRSLNIPDPISRLWPYVLAGVENEISVGVSFTLLRADPSILHLAMKEERKKSQKAQEMLRLAAEAELEDQSSRRIRRLTIRDTEG